MHDLYSENYKILLRESKDKRNKYKDIPRPLIWKVNIGERALLSKLIHRVNIISINILADLSVDIDTELTCISMEMLRRARTFLKIKKLEITIKFQNLYYHSQ